MFARHRQLLQTAIFFLDALLLFASWCAAYWLRFHVLRYPAPLGVPPIERYLLLGAVLTPLGLLILRSFHLYRSARTARSAPGDLRKSVARRPSTDWRDRPEHNCIRGWSPGRR